MFPDELSYFYGPSAEAPALLAWRKPPTTDMGSNKGFALNEVPVSTAVLLCVVFFASVLSPW